MGFHLVTLYCIFLKSSFLLFEPFLLCKGIFKLSTEYNHFESIPWAKNSVHCRTYAACTLRSEQKSEIFFFSKSGFSEIVRGLNLMEGSRKSASKFANTYLLYLFIALFFFFHFYRLLLLLLKYLYCLPSNAIFC